MICCFTGHRSYKLRLNPQGKTRLKKKLFLLIKNLIEEKGVTTFYTGMAEGIDIWAAQCVIELKKTYDLTLIAAIPFLGQEEKWSKADKELYHNVLEKCDERIILSTRYYDRCLLIRNEYMVDRSDILLAVFNGSYGGTKYTVDYAAKKGLEIITINPDEF